MNTIRLQQLAWYDPRELALPLPDVWHIEVCNMAGYNRPALKPDEIKTALNKPIGTAPIRELAKGKKEVVIIFDDMTRVTRVAEIAPFVLEELTEAGIPDSNIRFVMALGCHGAKDRRDFIKKLGEDVLARFPVYNHNAFGNCTYVGTTATFKTKVYVNEEVAKCDLKIAIGSVVPHPTTGFGGGGKIILPGVASFETIEYHHGTIYRIVREEGKPVAGMGIFDNNPSRIDIEEAARRATIVEMLVSDAAQKAIWPLIKKNLHAGDALYFSHGFSIVYNDQTKIIPPNDVDVIMVAPKGSGTSLRRNYLSGAGINSSFAVEQDATGRARDRCIALGIAIGSGYLFPTTFKHEVYSDLTGERGVLMGALAGIMEAQYDVFRKNGHSPSEAFNETVEELTQSLIKLVDENGMDWMYLNCSATAQRGALDWKPKFKKAVMPVFKDIYKRVKSGQETSRVLSVCGKSNYQVRLAKELNTMASSEMWQAGKATRSLRPKEAAVRTTKATKGLAGRKTY